MPFKNIQAPSGEKITYANGRLHVPDHPSSPLSRATASASTSRLLPSWYGTRLSRRFTTARRRIAWMEILCREKATEKYDGNYMPEENLRRHARAAIVGIRDR